MNHAMLSKDDMDGGQEVGLPAKSAASHLSSEDSGTDSQRTSDPRYELYARARYGQVQS